MIEESNEYYDPLLDDIDMVTLMEDVDSESGSQNGLQGVDAYVEDSAHEKEGTMATRERQGTPREAHTGSSGCSYHKQTVSITTVTVIVFLSCYSNVFLNYWCGF